MKINPFRINTFFVFSLYLHHQGSRNFFFSYSLKLLIKFIPIRKDQRMQTQLTRITSKKKQIFPKSQKAFLRQLLMYLKKGEDIFRHFLI